MDKRLTWAGGAVLVIALVYWLFQEGAVEASDVQRPLSSARFDQNPFGVEMPEAWQAELRAAIARAPQVSLLESSYPVAIPTLFLTALTYVPPLQLAAGLAA